MPGPEALTVSFLGAVNLSKPHDVLDAVFGQVLEDASAARLLTGLPVRGSGDGGIYSTAADISALWQSLFTGRIVPDRWVTEMVRPRSDVPAESMRYGLGFWLGQDSDTVILEGYDAGVSFRSVHDPGSAVTRTVISHSSDGAWPIARRLEELLAG